MAKEKKQSYLTYDTLELFFTKKIISQEFKTPDDYRINNDGLYSLDKVITKIKSGVKTRERIF
ncbi:MAG: hypothetical protein Q7U04_17055 [Bacteriovorax sp.]|nr:hypothetical protein [Bacteriovorax sp.]